MGLEKITGCGTMTPDEKQAVHINLISKKEMMQHAHEMRKENDSKFVSCLMATGLTRAEAMKEVRIWNAQKEWTDGC